MSGLSWSVNPAQADEEATFAAGLDVKKKDDSGKPTESVLGLNGKVVGFPPGARIDVRFRLKGNRQHINWYRMLLDANGACKYKSSVLKTPFAPGTYEVQFWLKIKTQNRDIKRWFKLNRGWTRSHQELLDSKEIVVGTDAEKKGFDDECIAELNKMLKDVRTLFDALHARVNAGTAKDAAWDKAYQGEHRKKILAVQTALATFRTSHAAMPFEEYRGKLRQVINNTLKLYKYYSQGKTGLKPRFEHVVEIIKYLKTALEPAQPLLPEGPKKKEGKKG